VEVRNTGPVVPPAAIESILQPFQRLTGERTAAGGTGAGLGLSIVRSVAWVHGGSLAVRPREQGGLAVRVELPSRPPQPGNLGAG
jgi:signal transduction histidine kinase